MESETENLNEPQKPQLNIGEAISRYSFDDIMKFSDGWWITFWSPTQRRVVKSNGPYKTKDEAKCDVMVLNARY
jgi:hypothetical protein